MGEAVEDLFLEELVPQASVEAFDEGVRRRLAGRNVMPADAVLVRPFEHRATGQLCPVVAEDRRWLAVETDKARRTRPVCGELSIARASPAGRLARAASRTPGTSMRRSRADSPATAPHPQPLAVIPHA